MMNQIEIDEALAARIRQHAGPTELVDTTGHVVAAVHPPGGGDLCAHVGDEFSPEEIEHRCRAEQQSYTAEELVAKLRSLS